VSAIGFGIARGLGKVFASVFKPYPSTKKARANDRSPNCGITVKPSMKGLTHKRAENVPTSDGF
jgi:hypothetical protein